jgi:hypothetical protein
MFGYIIINKQEMKFKEFDVYKSYYCGFCQALKESYGKLGQATLSYDLTFLILLLTSLYEPETVEAACRCVAHPFEKHLTRRNQFSQYAADMNLLLSYYKGLDDWQDERKLKGKALSDLLKGRVKTLGEKYPKKASLIRQRLGQIQECEKKNTTDIDQVSGYFGDIMAEIFAVKEDAWERELRRMGFFMGKFIYLMDAYEDVEKDKKSGNYNPLLPLYETGEFEERCHGILNLMMADCSRAFEKLPLLENTEILRNILYSGVWCRYELVRERRRQERESKEAGSR